MLVLVNHWATKKQGLKYFIVKPGQYLTPTGETINAKFQEKSTIRLTSKYFLKENFPGTYL